jgi:hypothetical protein
MPHETEYFQDYEVINKYQMYSYVIFLRPESAKKVPLSGYTFHIPAPVIMENRPGGLGLDDISHLLESADIDKSFEFAPVPPIGTKYEERIIGARISRRRM